MTKPQHTKEQIESIIITKVRREPNLSKIETVVILGPIVGRRWNWTAEPIPSSENAHPAWVSILSSLQIECDLKT